MKTAIILVSFKNGDEVIHSIKSCLSQKECGALYIVNNGNSDTIIEKLNNLAKTDNRLVLINAEGNLGFGAACNLAARNIDLENFVFLNPDAVLKPGALIQLMNTLHECQNAIIGGLITDNTGKEQRGARRSRLGLLNALLSFSGLSRPGEGAGFLRDFNQNREPLPPAPIEVGAISGAFFAIRKSDFERLGGFDEKYFLHVEDIDLCARHKALGGKIIFDPNAIVTHIGGASNASKYFVEWHKFKGLMRYFLKFESFSGKIGAILVSPFLLITLMGRVFISRILSVRHR